MRTKIVLSFLLLNFVGIFVVSQTAEAHARWRLGSLTPPRTNSTGLKTDPCGGATRTATPKIFQPNQTIEVEWEETINHPGYFRIAFSPAADSGFDENVLIAKIDDTQGVETPMPHLYKAMITLPNMQCENCSLQLIQVMTENPANPRNYYSCSDIVLRANVEPVPVTPPPPPVEPPQPVALDVLAKMLLDDFAAVDVDGNNVLSYVEVIDAIPNLTIIQFINLDKDANSLLSQADLMAHLPAPVVPPEPPVVDPVVDPVADPVANPVANPVVEQPQVPEENSQQPIAQPAKNNDSGGGGSIEAILLVLICMIGSMVRLRRTKFNLRQDDVPSSNLQ